MNAQAIATPKTMPRRVKRVGDEMIRLARRPQGATIEELCALSGQKEQTARSRISKLKEKGFNIYRDPETNRYHFVPPTRPGARGDEGAEQAAIILDEMVEADVTGSDVPDVDGSRIPNLGTVKRLLEILSQHREIHAVGYSGGMVLMWDEAGKQGYERLEIDLPKAVEAFA